MSSSDKNPATSLSLLDRAINGQPDAWHRLTELYTPLVYSWCRKNGADAESASDITQVVFLTVYEKLKSFKKEEDGSSFRGWLWTVTRSKVMDHFRKLAREAAQPGGGTEARLFIQELPQVEPATWKETGSIENSLLAKAMKMVRSEFEPKTWEAFWMSITTELKAKEIGEELGMSEGAVRKAKHRVLKRLREEYSESVILKHLEAIDE